MASLKCVDWTRWLEILNYKLNKKQANLPFLPSLCTHNSKHEKITSRPFSFLLSDARIGAFNIFVGKQTINAEELKRVHRGIPALGTHKTSLQCIDWSAACSLPPNDWARARTYSAGFLWYWALCDCSSRLLIDWAEPYVSAGAWSWFLMIFSQERNLSLCVCVCVHWWVRACACACVERVRERRRAHLSPRWLNFEGGPV